MHRCDVDDETWAATVVGDRLRVRGDIDVSNVDRFTRVLRSAVTAGVSTVDLSEVGFFARAAASTSSPTPPPRTTRLRQEGRAVATSAASAPGAQLDAFDMAVAVADGATTMPRYQGKPPAEQHAGSL